MRRILVIDDEAQIRRLLEITLSNLEWEVFSAPTGLEGIEAARGVKPDLILLDLNLPDMSGAGLLSRLREWSSVPVIVISVRDSERDVVELLNSGADDYVVKPFYTNELVARIEAVHRRRMPGREPVFRSGRLAVDAERREVRAMGELVRLTPTEYSILDILVRYAGRIVTRERLLKEVWGPAWEAEEGSLRVYINALRRKLEADPSAPALIVTEAGVGYRLEALPADPDADAGAPPPGPLRPVLDEAPEPADNGSAGGSLGYDDTMTAIAAAHRRLDELASSGAGPPELERFIVGVFVERNRSIRNADFQRLDPRTVTDDYLRPRAELYRFVVARWIRLIFLPSLKPRVADELFMFGLGRLFSSYNDMGVQHCTDVDLNVVVGDALGKADLRYLADRLAELKLRLQELFDIVLEIDPAYTILRATEVAARLAHEDDEIREANARFYKSNERSISVLKDQPEIREGLFSLVRAEPASRIFENFLGFKGPKPSYAKLRTGSERLPIIAEGGERVLAGAVIGSKSFEAYCRRALPQGRFLSPPDWVFSMKYFVNRVYDYVGAMRCQGHGLEAIGFDEPVRGGGKGISSDRQAEGLDPDYRFLRNAHKLMLYLQELITIVIGSFGGAKCDYSYISRSRFLRFMEINGDKFRRDFEDMVLGGDLLLMSEKKSFLTLTKKIASKSNDRFLELGNGELSRLPQGLAYELVHRDDHCARIGVPYSWSDLGFFVFSRIASRMGRIVDARLVPRLPSFGMADEDYRLYAERLADAAGT